MQIDVVFGFWMKVTTGNLKRSQSASTSPFIVPWAFSYPTVQHMSLVYHLWRIQFSEFVCVCTDFHFCLFMQVRRRGLHQVNFWLFTRDRSEASVKAEFRRDEQNGRIRNRDSHSGDISIDLWLLSWRTERGQKVNGQQNTVRQIIQKLFIICLSWFYYLRKIEKRRSTHLYERLRFYCI